jgi:hypothetical protein
VQHNNYIYSRKKAIMNTQRQLITLPLLLITVMPVLSTSKLSRCTLFEPVVPPIAAPPPGSGQFDEDGFFQTPLLLTTDNVKQIDHSQSGFNAVPDGQAASSPTQSTSLLQATASSGFESVHPIAVTAFDDQIFAFGVASDGRMMFQIFGYNQGVGLWLTRWEEVPGMLRTDTRVTAAVMADRLFLFARNPENRTLAVNIKSAGCTATGCWSGWGAETLPEDFGARKFFVTSARDGRLFLIIDGPYERPLPTPSPDNSPLVTQKSHRASNLCYRSGVQALR